MVDDDIVGMVRNPDHDTSEAAAYAMVGKRERIRAEVNRYALRRPDGFIDEDLTILFDPSTPESSYRKRRTELTEAGVIMKTAERRRNSHGRACIVWLHVSHARALL